MSSRLLGLVALVICCYGADAAPKIHGKELHHHMTIRELEHYFGVSEHSDVPDYDVATPFQSNEHGHFVSYNLDTKRRRRSAYADEHSHYHVTAFRRNMHMKLKRNNDVMARGLSVETVHDDMSVTRELLPRSDRHYLGHIKNDPNSMVAVSNYEGLSGMIQTSDDDLFVQPLTTHLAQHFATKKDMVPHLFSRPSLKKGSRFESSDSPLAMHLNSHPRARRQVAHKYIEAAIMVDEEIQAHYGNWTDSFILILGNMLSGMFYSRSIGDIKPTYVITRIIKITNQQLGTTANATNGAKLHKVTEWARTNNAHGESNPLHFDILSLIHRGKSGGLALLGGMCASDSSNVNKDNGLQTAIVMAHETAHCMGADHDSTADCPSGVNIMSGGIPGGTGAMKWSNCTKQVLQNFLGSPVSSCLNDAPSPNRPQLEVRYRGKLPGVIWNADKQCEYNMGKGYFQCPHKVGECKSLFCTKNGWTCPSNVAPSADGTRCGKRHWCIQGSCVDDGSPYIAGGWSSWTEFRQCTQSCDGGVKYRERTCTNPPPQNGGNECEGSSNGHFEICNPTPCAPSLLSYRDQQCIAKNPDYRGYYHADTCALVCSKASQAYFFGKVRDGTRCYADKFKSNVCIEGVCRAVGCDNVLGSGKAPDRCGKCDGDGSSCKLINGSYTKDWRQWGLDKPDTMVTLPVGSTLAVFKKKSVTWNLIGVRNNKVPNAYLMELPTWTKSITAVGTKITYIHEANQFKDELYVLGPTTEEVNIVFVWLYQPNQGITYKYYAPLTGGESEGATTYTWKATAWKACSATCAGGIQLRTVTCHRTDDNTTVGHQYCDAATKPIASRVCNTISCKAEWHVTKWQPCTKTCGKGSKSRLIQCHQKVNETYHQMLPESSCSGSVKPNVTTFEYCNEIRCPAEWTASAWSQCSTTCGPGNTTRSLVCKQINGQGIEQEVSLEHCIFSTEPPVIEPCNTDKPCGPPPELKIACFRDSSTPSGLPELLADFTSTVDFDNTKATVLACAQLAHNKGYKYFGLGNGGKCYSGPNVKTTYYKDGPSANRAGCNNGVGLDGYQFVYTLVPLPPMEGLGCFLDKASPDRVFSNYLNFRPQLVWEKLNATVLQCAHVARDKGYNLFGVQYFGECWTGTTDYAKWGGATNCIAYMNSLFVGRGWSNFVYKFKPVSASLVRK